MSPVTPLSRMPIRLDSKVMLGPIFQVETLFKERERVREKKGNEVARSIKEHLKCGRCQGSHPECGWDPFVEAVRFCLYHCYAVAWMMWIS